MKTNFFLSVISCILLVACDKNETNFFNDSQKKDLSIFSNTGNNIFTANINGNAWKTRNRINSGYTYKTTFEISLEKIKTNTTKDILVITWFGAEINSFQDEFIALQLTIDSSFKNNDFKTIFEGKRIEIDSSLNGYFTTNLNATNSNKKGNGVVYFHNANMDRSTSPFVSNKIVGLLNTKIGNTNIADARFDHDVNELSINF